uniref:Uncharacterized protein n=1 Tax=Anopheles culicifacies TaxID=139723 RepID=A0A182M607_9DIPT
MPRSSRKNQKTTKLQRSNPNNVSTVQEQPEDIKPDEKKFVLFGKCIAMDEHSRQASYYAKLRFWFRHATPKQENTPAPRMGTVAANEMCASPSTTRQSHQELDDTTLSSDPCGFQRVPSPLATDLTPYPVVVPVKKNITLPEDILNDPKSLLKYHKTHWKLVRKHWILHRCLYLERYKPCIEFIASTYLPPMHQQ